jgi:thiamine-phosphate pyrophosphorylase
MELPRIWLITMPEDPRGPVAPIERSLEGVAPGLVGVQLRAKASSDREVLSWGRQLREVTRRRGCTFVVNRRADIAALVDADGVHLPEAHLGVPEVRSFGPSERWLVGVSCHDRQGLARAASEGADYAFLSPLFEVPGKAPPLGIEGFREAIGGVGIPTFALGGIQAVHVDPAIRAGAAGVALRRPAYAADPASTLSNYLRELDKHG